MLPQTKHTNQPTTMSIKQWAQKRSLSLYGIDGNMHPQKQKCEVSHENVIENPKHFHWKPMHNKQLKNLMITFPSSTLKDIIFWQQFHLRIKIHSSIFSFTSTSLKKCNSCRKY
jgi:hypothetical protein